MFVLEFAGSRPKSNPQGPVLFKTASPEYRRQGIARHLLRECEKRLTAKRLRLCVRLDNDSAIRLYEQEGYLRVCTWTKYYNDGGDALVMEKSQTYADTFLQS